MYVTKVNLEITSELVWMVFIGSYYMEQQSKKKLETIFRGGGGFKKVDHALF